MRLEMGESMAMGMVVVVAAAAASASFRVLSTAVKEEAGSEAVVGVTAITAASSIRDGPESSPVVSDGGVGGD